MKRRERLSWGSCRKISGLLLLVLGTLSTLGVVFGAEDTWAVIGGNGSQPTGGGGGGNIGAALVHYKYVKSSGTAVVGTSTSPMGARSETISNDCRSVGGFWHIEWADLSSGKSGGSAAAARTLGEMKATSNGFASYLSDADGNAAKNKVNSDNYNDVVEPDKIVTPVNFKRIYDEIYNNSSINNALIPAGKSSPMPFGPASTQGVYSGDDTSLGLGQCWGSGGSNCYGYISDYSGTYGSPKNEIFVDSTFSYFCGTTSGGGGDTYVRPTPTTTVKPAGSSGTDWTKSGSTYTFTSTGTKTINYTFKITRNDSINASGTFRYRGYKEGAYDGSSKDVTVAQGGSKQYSNTSTVTVSENDSPQEICGRTYAWYNKWNGSSFSVVAYNNAQHPGTYAETCIKVQGPRRADPVDTFTDGTPGANVTVSTSDFTSGNGTESNPYTAKAAGSYTVTRTGTATRSSSDTYPNDGLLAYRTSDTGYSGSWTNSGTNAAFSKGQSKTVKNTTTTVTVAEDDDAQQFCTYTEVVGAKYTDSTWTDWNWVSTSPNKGWRASKCIWVRGPRTSRVNFSATLGITYNETDDDGTLYYRGNGTDTSFSIQGSYTIKRAASPTSPATETTQSANRFGEGVNSYATSFTDTTPGLAPNGTKAYTTSAVNVSVPIGTSKANAKQVCLYVNYSSYARYTNGVLAGRGNASSGRKNLCVYVYNPALTATVSFSGLSKVGLDGSGSTTTASLSNENSTAFGAGPNTSNYTTIEAKVKYASRTGTKTYSATFAHYLKYTSTLPTWLENAPKTNYVIQYCTDGCDSYSNNTGSSWGASVGLSSSWTQVNTNNYTLTVNAGNGKYARVCQRIRYYGSAPYTSAVTGGKKGTRGSLDSATVVNSTPACVIIKNPAWINGNDGEYTRTVTVTGAPTFDKFKSGAVYSTKTGQYLMKDLSAVGMFGHTLTRVDTGFNEEAMDKAIDSSGEVDRRMASSPSISTFDVITRYKGRAKTYVGATGSTESDVQPQGGSGGAYSAPLLKPDPSGWTWVGTDPREFTSPPSTWSSTAYTSSSQQGRGWTGTTLTYEAGSWRSLAAGETKKLVHKNYNSPTTWTLGYSDNYDFEAYCSNVYSSGSCTAQKSTGGAKYYRNTVRGGSSLVADSSSNNTSGESSVTVHRDWNFDITSFIPHGVGSDNAVLAAGEKMDVQFAASIKKDTGWNAYDVSPSGYGLSSALNRSYITAVGDGEQLKVITYVIKTKDGDDANYYSTIESATDGDITGDSYGGNYCRFFQTKLGSYLDQCEVGTENQNFSYSIGTGNDWVMADSGAGYTGKIAPNDLVVPNLEPGYKYCVAIGASKKSSTNGNGVISGSYCTNIVKKPSVHVWGGSIAANGKVSTSITSVKPDGGSKVRIYASWTDLGIVAGGAVNRMSSGRASASNSTKDELGGVPCGSVQPPKYSPLTIANVCATEDGKAVVGKSGVDVREISTKTFDSLKSKYVDNGTYSTNVGDAADLAKGTAVGSIPAGGGAKVIYCSGDCVVKDNIIMDGSYSSASDIPQVMIIANGDIKINEAVTRVDAWLIAQGAVDTCTYTDGGSERSYVFNGNDLSGSQRRLTASVCTNQLIVNGPIMGGTLNLTRTYGADNAVTPSKIAEEGERSTLPGTTLLFAGNEAQIGEPSTTYLKKLPVRW